MNKSLRHQLKEAYPEHRERQSVHRETGSNNDILAGWLSEHLPHCRPKPSDAPTTITFQLTGKEMWIASLSTRDEVFRGLDTDRNIAAARCLAMAQRRQN
jgi:hypothetical protein